MSNNPIRMHLVRHIILSLQRGVSQRQIARQLGLSRNTVSLYVSRLESSGNLELLLQLDDATLSALVYPAQKPVTEDARQSDFTSRIPHFLSELKRTGVTRQLLWQEYRQAYPQGYQYTQFCQLLARNKKVNVATMHFEHPPGQMLMVDFAGDHICYVERESGELISCPVLVCVLPFSGYSYVEALANASLPQVVKALNACLDYLGGVPLQLKSDNMKQLVHKSCRYEPVFTEMIQQWALHNQMGLLAARVRKPKDKAAVENEVKLTYQRIYAPLRDKTFFSLRELNTAIRAQLAEHHRQPFQKREGSRHSCFTTLEQPQLQPLPPQPYQLRYSLEAKVQKNYHLTLGQDWHHYSVPFVYISKKVQLVYDTDLVEVYYQHQRIAFHQRSYRKHGYTTLKEHMPQGHRSYLEQQGWDADYFLEQAQKIGTATGEYVEKVLQGKRFAEQTYRACLGILRLGKSYSAERLEAACHRALQGNTYTYLTLKNILEHNLDKLQAQPPPLFSVPAHDNVRGAQTYQ
jgi:transposase